MGVKGKGGTSGPCPVPKPRKIERQAPRQAPRPALPARPHLCVCLWVLPHKLLHAVIPAAGGSGRHRAVEASTGAPCSAVFRCWARACHPRFVMRPQRHAAARLPRGMRRLATFHCMQNCAGFPGYAPQASTAAGPGSCQLATAQRHTDSPACCLGRQRRRARAHHLQARLAVRARQAWLAPAPIVLTVGCRQPCWREATVAARGLREGW